VVDGPFPAFTGTVAEAKPHQGKVRVLISPFGRAYLLELDLGQVEMS
jgi:transcription antitermination factor NusG